MLFDRPNGKTFRVRIYDDKLKRYVSRSTHYTNYEDAYQQGLIWFRDGLPPAKKNGYKANSRVNIEKYLENASRQQLVDVVKLFTKKLNISAKELFNDDVSLIYSQINDEQ